jgi:tetratricopeptide (TPR) repeat protein
MVEQQLHGFAQEAKYWEKWRIDPGLFRRAFVRYKYFVLAAYPREEYERRLRWYERLVTDRQKAGELIRAGRPVEAAALLETLLDDYPDAAIPVRFALADAYQQAQLLDRAVEVLEAARELVEDEERRVRLEERIEQLECTFPDMGARSAYVVVRGPDGELSGAPFLRDAVEEISVLSNVELAGFQSDGHPPPSAREADWTLALELRWLIRPRYREIYDTRLYSARAECTARIRGTADGRILSNRTAAKEGTGSDSATAAHKTLRSAMRAAVRRCLLDMVQ